MVGAVRPKRVNRLERGLGQRGWEWTAWISALLQEMDDGLGAGLSKDGKLNLPETVCWLVQD